MNIGPHTVEEFKEMARRFHGYPAPGLLLGGYMVERAKSLMPEGVLYEAVVETSKCLPDAVQLLTVLSIGNGWMRIVNLGRYAVAFYDKYSGAGWRVHLDSHKLEAWPHMKSWLCKLTPKKEQDTPALLVEIEQAGDTVCSWHRIQMHARHLGKSSMGDIGRCPICHEYYPTHDGPICRGCMGDEPYLTSARLPGGVCDAPPIPAVSIPVEDAVGKTVLHDMTRIVPGESKGVEFSAGQVLTGGDLCRLHQMGRAHVYVQEHATPNPDQVHENDAVLAFAKLMAGPGVTHSDTPREGKLDFRPEHDGLFVVDRALLTAFNLVPDVMCATRQSEIYVEKGKPVAGARAIPLYLSKERLRQALDVLSQGQLLRVLPLRPLAVGVLVTGTEVFKGLVEDKFLPVVTGKVEHFGCRVIASEVQPDDRASISAAVRRMLAAGAELLITTAGLSVDPDDVTRHGLQDAGMDEYLYGAPILPGAMTLIGAIGQARVIGVPACALFHKTTSLDLLLPRVLADRPITRRDLAAMAEGAFCLNCNACTFPKCPFGK